MVDHMLFINILFHINLTQMTPSNMLNPVHGLLNYNYVETDWRRSSVACTPLVAIKQRHESMTLILF